jgi:hypothetical protein
VHLDVPLPPNTVFYRAAFVNLPANAASGQDGYLAGTVLAPNAIPAGFGITTPGFLTNGTVSFTFSQLPAGYDGDAMIELIISNAAIAQAGSLVGSPNNFNIVFADNTAPNVLARAQQTTTPIANGIGNGRRATATLSVTPIADATRVPQIGVSKICYGPLYAGKNFEVTFILFNYGDTEARGAQLTFPLPPNTSLVSETHTVFGSSHVIIDNPSGIPNPGDAMDLFIDALPPHSASAITFTLKATGAIGAIVEDDNTYFSCNFAGLFYTTPTRFAIEAEPLIPKPPIYKATITGHPMNQYFFNGGDALVIDLGGGHIVAQGGGNIVAQGGGNIVASGGGNIVAQGGGNLIPIGITDGATLLSNTAAIVAQGGGNVVVPQGSSIVAQGGGNIVAAGAGNIVAQGGGNIVATGGGNIIAQGGGNIVATGGGNIFGTGGGQIVAQGGGNIVAQGGGNIVAQGGGNLIAAGGGGIVAQGGGNILNSLANSSAVITSPHGNIVAQGGGNIVAQGAGN